MSDLKLLFLAYTIGALGLAIGSGLVFVALLNVDPEGWRKIRGSLGRISRRRAVAAGIRADMNQHPVEREP